jgi:drug/metabolite transporter (DMT)-like permease
VSFPAIKMATPYVSSTLFVAIRFSIATLLMIAAWPWLLRLLPAAEARRGWSLCWLPEVRRHGLELGLLISVGYTTQTVGMHTTSASNSAFLTALSVILVPVFLFLLRGVRPRLVLLASILLATGGLVLLTNPQAMVVGDLWTLGTAVAYAVYLIRLSDALRVCSFLPLMFWTIAVCAVVNAIAAATLEPPRLVMCREVVVSLALTTVLSTLVALYLQNRYQGESTPTRAALIFAAEPVFAAFFAWLALGDTLTGGRLAGAGLILAAVLGIELFGAPAETATEDREIRT